MLKHLEYVHVYMTFSTHIGSVLRLYHNTRMLCLYSSLEKGVVRTYTLPPAHFISSVEYLKHLEQCKYYANS